MKFTVGDILKTQNLCYVITNVSKCWLRLERSAVEPADNFYREHEDYTKKAITHCIKEKEMTFYPIKERTEHNISIADLIVSKQNSVYTVVGSSEETLSIEWYNNTRKIYETSKYDRRMVNLWIDEGTFSLIKAKS
jgi:hypothetical protein